MCDSVRCRAGLCIGSFVLAWDNFSHRSTFFLVVRAVLSCSPWNLLFFPISSRDFHGKKTDSKTHRFVSNREKKSSFELFLVDEMKAQKKQRSADGLGATGDRFFSFLKRSTVIQAKQKSRAPRSCSTHVVNRHTQTIGLINKMVRSTGAIYDERERQAGLVI